MAARTPPQAPGAQGGGQGAVPLGGAGSCARASVPFPEPEVMLRASLECPFEPLNGVRGAGGNLNIIFF